MPTAQASQVLTSQLRNAIKFSVNPGPAVNGVGGGVDDTETAYYVMDKGAGFDRYRLLASRPANPG